MRSEVVEPRHGLVCEYRTAAPMVVLLLAAIPACLLFISSGSDGIDLSQDGVALVQSILNGLECLPKEVSLD